MSVIPQGCPRHRVYTSAVADRERALVPWRARLHIRLCRGCRRELAAQVAVSRRLRESLAVQPTTIPAGRSRAPARLAATAVAGGAAAIAAVLVLAAHPDQVPAAVTAAAQRPTFVSSDAASIATWCVDQSRMAPPMLTVPALVIEGARMDASSGGGMLTVYYGAPSGGSLTVTWVGMSTARPRSARIDARAIDGHTVLVAHDQTAMAVVAGTAAPADLRRAAIAAASRS